MISFEEAIQIHELLILKFGGSAGLRDPEALKSSPANSRDKCKTQRCPWWNETLKFMDN